MSESKTTSTTPPTPTNPRRRFSNFDEREERGESREVDEWNQHQMEAVFPHASSNNAYLLTAGYWDWSFRASPLCGKKSSSSSFSGGGGGSGSSGGAQREDVHRCPQPLHTVQHHRAETTCLAPASSRQHAPSLHLLLCLLILLRKSTLAVPRAAPWQRLLALCLHDLQQPGPGSLHRLRIKAGGR